MTFHAIARQRAFAGTFLTLGAAWLFLLSMFHALPSIDIAVSEFFFSGTACETSLAPVPCGHFSLSTDGQIKALRWGLYALPYMGAAIVVSALVLGAVSRRWRERLPIRRLWLSLISLGIGTGLITNVLLKGHWGRPRPIQTDLFGGTMAFMPAGSFAGACERNCSFISGEASGAGWLICLLILLPPRYRAWIAPPVIVASVATAFLRVAVGAHFTSDVILGWLLSILVFIGLLALEQSVADD
jgi:membrane-associated phospholipid phosphatase